MKKIFAPIFSIVGLILAILLLKHIVPFVFETVLELFLIKETAEAVLPSWLSIVFDCIAGIIAVFVLHFRQSERQFEVATTIISFVLIVIASHIAAYSWFYFAMLCLALLCGLLKLISNIIESNTKQQEN